MCEENTNDKSARHKAEALSIIKNQVKIYKKKLTMYGYSSEEIVLCIKKCLGKILGHDLSKEKKTDDVMNVIEKCLKNKKNKEIDMLIDIITNFDIEINELESEEEEELCSDKNMTEADVLKVETEEKHSNNDECKEAKENLVFECVSEEGEGESYVKLQPIVWMENNEREKVNKKVKRMKNKRWELDTII